MLHRGWQLKKQCSSEISTDAIDDWYARALAAGALGGKLLGAGGGGFLLMYVPPDAQDAVCRALPELRRLPFDVEASGTNVIFRR
jgi:D-glycero-alpha-D-manno-heptose-7-phosphate kinase